MELSKSFVIGEKKVRKKNEKFVFLDGNFVFCFYWKLI